MARKSNEELFDKGESERPAESEQPTNDKPADVNGDGAAKVKPPDPFDPASLRLSQDFPSMVGTEKLLIVVPVRKPGKEIWFRAHPDDDYRLDTIVLELKEDSETYLVTPDLHSLFGTEPTMKRVTLFTGISRNNDVFLWPVALPGADGKDNDWNRSAREAAALAMERWVRIVSNRSLGAYEPQVTRAEIPEPRWPNKSFSELLRLAFRDRFIQSADHPVLQRLRGEV